MNFNMELFVYKENGVIYYFSSLDNLVFALREREHSHQHSLIRTADIILDENKVVKIRYDFNQILDGSFSLYSVEVCSCGSSLEFSVKPISLPPINKGI